jgi:hypothetical protein
MAVVLVTLAAVPPYVYHPSGLPLYANNKRLPPFAALMMNRNNKIQHGDCNSDLQGFLGLERCPDIRLIPTVVVVDPLA